MASRASPARRPKWPTPRARSPLAVCFRRPAAPRSSTCCAISAAAKTSRARSSTACSSPSTTSSSVPDTFFHARAPNRPEFARLAAKSVHWGSMTITSSAAPIAHAIAELKSRLGPRATDAAAVREHHSHGESYHAPACPDVVCFPTSTEEVAAIAATSARYAVPIVPFGAGTSLEGHVNAIHGGITIDLREMKEIVRVSVDDLDATVEAGVTRLQLYRALRNTGLS